LKSVELVLKIGAKVGGMMRGMQSATNSVTKVQQTIEKLNSKKINIVANDSSVKKVKDNIEKIDNQLDDLKKRKTEISLGLNKNREAELNESIVKIENKIDTLKSKKDTIELKIKATTDTKELKKLNRQLKSTQTKIIGLSEEKLKVKEEFNEVRDANKTVTKELKKTSNEIKKINGQKLELKDELKEVQKEALETNSTIKNIEKTVNRLNGTTLKIKQIVERREILKTELLGNVQKVASMGVALGGVAFGIDRINKATVQMSNLADTVGLSFNTVNALGSAVKGIGLDYEHVTDIMEELNNKIGESKVVYLDWLKEDKGKGKELKLVGGVDDAFKGLDFSLSDKSFKGLNYEEQFKKFSGLKGDKQFEIVMDTALKMKDQQKAASMVDILMGGEANKILSFLRKQGKSYKEFIEDKKKLIFLDEEGLKGAKAYAKASATSASIVSSVFQQFSGIGGGFMSPVLDKFNKWLVLNKKIVKSNIKGFFVGIKSALGSVGNGIDYVYGKLKPLTNLLGITSNEANKAGESGERFGKALTYIGAGLGGLLAVKMAIGATKIATGYASNGIRLLRLSYLKLNAVALATRGSTALSMLSFKNLGKVAKATGRIMLRTPIGLAIAGIALGAVMVRKYWEPIKGFFVGVVLGIGDALGTVKTIFSTVFGAMEYYIRPIITILEPIGDIFKTVFGTAVGYIKQLIKPLSSVSDSVASATANGRSFGQWLGYIGAGVGGVLALKGAFMILAPAIGAVGSVLAFVGRTLLLNPIGLAVTAIAGSAYLIYSNWGKVSGFFSSLWSGVKNIFSSAWEGIKSIFSWTPLGVLANNWQPILNFIGGIGTGVKNLLGSAWNGLKSIVSWNPLDFVAQKWNGLMNFFSNFSLKDAGSKIISSVIDGMSATWQKLTKKVGDITKSIRDFFPFSPAKKGALTDIHRIKLMETVASGINDKVLAKSVNNATIKARKALKLGTAGLALSSSIAVANPTQNNNVSSENRVFQTKEMFSQANINHIKDRSFKTQEILSQANLPTLQDRSFSTIENLKLAKVPSLQNRAFQTKELLSKANINPIKDRSFETFEAPKPFTIASSDAIAGQNQDSNVNNYVNNSQITVSIGDIIVQTTDGKVSEPHLLQEQIKQLVQDGIEEANNNHQDRQFADIGGLG